MNVSAVFPNPDVYNLKQKNSICTHEMIIFIFYVIKCILVCIYVFASCYLYIDDISKEIKLVHVV